MISTEFLLTSLIIVLVPGTGVIYTVSNGLFGGKSAAFAAACGCTLGIVPHLAASIFGLSAILHTSAEAFFLVKYCGVIYLLYLAYTMWRETGTFTIEKGQPQSTLLQIGTRGILINILNPKLSIFFLSFLPLFISPENQNPLPQMFLLSAIFMVITLIIFLLYGISADAARKQLLESPKAIGLLQKSFAGVFAALGVKLAFSQR